MSLTRRETLAALFSSWLAEALTGRAMAVTLRGRKAASDALTLWYTRPGPARLYYRGQLREVTPQAEAGARVRWTGSRLVEKSPKV